LYGSKTNDDYQFGSRMTDETKAEVSYDKRKYTFPSVPSNLYYHAGIQAFRRVDEDINRDGIILSDIVPFNIRNQTETLSNNRMIMEASTLSMESDDYEESERDEIFENDGNEVISEPYQPTEVVNLIGKVNNSRHTVSPNEPENPDINDTWMNTNDVKTRVWDGEEW